MQACTRRMLAVLVLLLGLTAFPASGADQPQILRPAERTFQPAVVSITVALPARARDLTLLDHGEVIYRSFVRGSVWTTSLRLGSGGHSVVASVTLADGTVVSGAQRRFTVDDQPPVVSVAHSPGAVLSGIADDNRAPDSGVARIEVRYVSIAPGGRGSQTARCWGCVGGIVTWRATPGDVLGATGLYHATIYAVDAVGNVSKPATALVAVTA